MYHIIIIDKKHRRHDDVRINKNIIEPFVLCPRGLFDYIQKFAILAFKTIFDSTPIIPSHQYKTVSINTRHGVSAIE